MKKLNVLNAATVILPAVTALWAATSDRGVERAESAKRLHALVLPERRLPWLDPEPFPGFPELDPRTDPVDPPQWWFPCPVRPEPWHIFPPPFVPNSPVLRITGV